MVYRAYTWFPHDAVVATVGAKLAMKPVALRMNERTKAGHLWWLAMPSNPLLNSENSCL